VIFCDPRLKRTAKPLFIGSLPIAASIQSLVFNTYKLAQKGHFSGPRAKPPFDAIRAAGTEHHSRQETRLGDKRDGPVMS
jgi:hypothetical protein